MSNLSSQCSSKLSKLQLPHSHHSSELRNGILNRFAEIPANVGGLAQFCAGPAGLIERFVQPD